MSLPSLRREEALARLRVDDALMDVHRRARLLLVGLGHEGRIDVVAQRRLAHRALEQEGLVGERERIAVIEIHLDLGDAFFMDQAVDADVLCFAIVVDVLEQRIELVDRVDAVGLASGLRAARSCRPAAAADSRDRCSSRRERIRARAPRSAASRRRRKAAARAAARCAAHERHRLAVLVGTVADHLRRRLLVPGHDAQRVDIRNQVHVRRLIGERSRFRHRRPSPSVRRSIPAGARC